MERDDEFVTVTETYWREGDVWYFRSDLDPDVVRTIPIYLVERTRTIPEVYDSEA
jgi:hypothetical protein